MPIIENIGFESGPESERMMTNMKFICIEDAQRKRDLSDLLRRGLSGWADAPEWLGLLYYELLTEEEKDANIPSRG